MDNKVQESLLELKATIDALEKQIRYLNRVSAQQDYGDDVIDEKLNIVTAKLVELEHTVKRIELQVDEIEEHTPTNETTSEIHKTRLDKRHEDESSEEESSLTWPLIVTIIGAVISFLAGPILELIKYLLK